MLENVALGSKKVLALSSCPKKYKKLLKAKLKSLRSFLRSKKVLLIEKMEIQMEMLILTV